MTNGFSGKSGRSKYWTRNTGVRSMKITAFALLAAVAMPGVATAQYSPPSRGGSVADDLARGVEDAARAIGTVGDALHRGTSDLRYREAERWAADRCGPEVARYGRMRIEAIQPYGDRGYRVYGVVDPGSSPVSYYGGRAYEARSFRCTIKDSGRVSVRTRRIRNG